MKKIYTLNEKNLKKEDQEFRKTAYGFEIYAYKALALTIFIVVLIASITIFFVSLAVDAQCLVVGMLAFIALLISILGIFYTSDRYNNSLKEYINSKN